MLSPTRLLSLFGLTAATALLCPSPAPAQTSPIKTVRVMSGLAAPLYVTHAPGDASRLFVLQQGSGGTALIRIFDVGTSTLLGTPFLTLTGLSTGGERGLLGLAFPPDHATTGLFYVYVSSTAAENAVWRYGLSSPNVANPASKFVILAMADPFSNHNGGWMGFGPDDYLYVATGDGGSGNDPQGNGQNINTLLGKMLRIDPAGVDAYPADVTKNYANPTSNPFFGATAGLDEIWHYGLRNPWRNSFDRTTGDMWIGDVGQNAVEEIDFQPVGAGGLNYGWRCMEGNNCTGLTGCTCAATTLTPPKQTYSHAGGACSVTGGYRYRGTALCDWNGTYFYADYCSSQISSFGFNGTTITNPQNRTAQLAPGGGLSIASITSFGEDANGELYIVDQNGGEVFKIVPGAIADCNSNGIHDACDIANATSPDNNGDGVPDECQLSAVPGCFGDGIVGPPCPCGNSGALLHGCANSTYPGGAILSAAGIAGTSTTTDTLVLTATDTPGPGLFFQATGMFTSPVHFGDGHLCAGIGILRLGVVFPTGGVSSYPGGLTPAPIHIAGSTSSGDVRHYQVWYRSMPGLCTTANFNLTQSLTITWTP